jgi:V/A-type H+-transporting ATPase subunit A
MTATHQYTTGRVNGIIANLVLVEVDGPVSQNEICFIQQGDTPLMAEVIKVMGDKASVQVFESTRGLRPGTEVRFEGHMLEATFGPGILSCNYDGLMHDLNTMTGIFLQRGDYTSALDLEKEWAFEPLAKAGDEVTAAHWLGQVDENGIAHKIMVPFKMKGRYTVDTVMKAGSYKVQDTIAVLKDERGKEYKVSMLQKFPVKQAVKAYREKPRPFQLLETGVRTIDTLNPMVEGGTGFIPGPFGSGKTV